jgi:23S rRNA (pseudouridine1915-N3)-methyltransferase
MHVSILAIGRIKDPALARVCDDYLNRLRRHHKVELVELRSDAEAQRRVSRGGRSAHLVALDVEGQMYRSEQLARWLGTRLADPAALQLVIGGAEGLSAELLDRAHERLSLGPLTLPHRLARLVLVEQLYRAVTILRGEPYHK